MQHYTNMSKSYRQAVKNSQINDNNRTVPNTGTPNRSIISPGSTRTPGNNTGSPNINRPAPGRTTGMPAGTRGGVAPGNTPETTMPVPNQNNNTDTAPFIYGEPVPNGMTGTPDTQPVIPGTRPTAPGTTPGMPMNRGTSPAAPMNGTAPGSRTTTPGTTPGMPMNRGTSPAAPMNGTAPGAGMTTPGSRTTTPGTTPAMPMNRGTSPAAPMNGTAPGAGMTTPGSRTTTPVTTPGAPTNITTPGTRTTPGSQPRMPMNGTIMPAMPNGIRVNGATNGSGNGTMMPGMPGGMPMNGTIMPAMPNGMPVPISTPIPEAAPGAIPMPQEVPCPYYQGTQFNNMYSPGSVPNNAPMGIPLYPLYGYDNCEDADRDMEYMRQLYPYTARLIQKEINNECDQMEYDGSLMFDEYPDKVSLDRIIDRIYDKVKNIEEEPQVEMNSLYHNPRRRSNYLRDIVSLILLNELFDRRRRYRRRRRWF